ncbi:hypothetical protein N7490_008936 [Penicillium lividum]|nr:hypothetical protein N7490_008936 [Penicillium lividum]
MNRVSVEKPRANLGDLPFEILENVAKHLSQLELLCLSLCNVWLYSSFPEAQYYHFNSDEGILLEFLRRLARSEPRHYLCHSCKRLHRVQSVEPPGPFSKPPKCHGVPSPYYQSAIDTNYHYLYLDQPLRMTQFPCYAKYKFYFVHLQLAMRSFTYGPEFGIPVESLFYTEVATSSIATNTNPAQPIQLDESQLSGEETQLNTQTTLFTVDARICMKQKSLCMRTQELVVVRREKVQQLSPGVWSDWIRICWHISTTASGSENNEIVNIVREFVKMYEGGEEVGKLIASGRCNRCNTAWKVQIREIERRDVCLVLTRWMNLGSGLNPQDSVWRSLIESKHSLRSVLMKHDPRVQFEHDSVQARSGKLLTEEALFWRNVELLRGKRYRRLMIKLDDSRWIDQSGEEWLSRDPGDKAKIEPRTGSWCAIF